jgi:polyhydroxyalkanoate synthesis regulator phasin
VHPPEPLLDSLRDRYHIPSRNDVDALTEQLDALSREVDALRAQAEPDA